MAFPLIWQPTKCDVNTREKFLLLLFCVAVYTQIAHPLPFAFHFGVCVYMVCVCAHTHLTYMGRPEARQRWVALYHSVLLPLRQSLSPKWMLIFWPVSPRKPPASTPLCCDNTGVAAGPPCLFQGPGLVSSDPGSHRAAKQESLSPARHLGEQDVVEQLEFQECPGSDISVAAQTRLASILVTPHPKNPAIIPWFYLMTALFKAYWGNLPSMPDYML